MLKLTKKMDGAKSKLESRLDNTTLNWIRLNFIVAVCLRDALLELLHDKKLPRYLPTDSEELYERMKTFKEKYEKKLQHVINDVQWEKICSSSDNKTHVDSWDITIIVTIIRNIKIVSSPRGGWNRKSIDKQDKNKGAFVCRARDARNCVIHGTIKMFDKNKFHELMKEIESVLNGLGYSHMNKLEEYKMLDLLEINNTEEIVTSLPMIISDIKDTPTDPTSNKAVDNKLGLLQNWMNDFSEKLQDLATKDEFQKLSNNVTMVRKELKELTEKVENITELKQKVGDIETDVKDIQGKLKSRKGLKN